MVDQPLHLVLVSAPLGERQSEFASFLLDATPQLRLHVVGLAAANSAGNRVQLNLATESILTRVIEPTCNLGEERPREISSLCGTQSLLKMGTCRREFFTAHDSTTCFEHRELGSCRTAED